MEILIGLIIIAILVLVTAIIWIINIQIPKQQSQRWINELEAQTNLLSHIKPTIAGNIIAWPVLRGDEIVIEHRIANGQQAQPIDAPPDSKQQKEIDAWETALDWVVASIAANPTGNQLLTGEKFGSGSGYDEAAKVMRSAGFIRTVSGGKGAGSFALDERGANTEVSNLLKRVSMQSAVVKLRRPTPV